MQNGNGPQHYWSEQPMYKGCFPASCMLKGSELSSASFWMSFRDLAWAWYNFRHQPCCFMSSTSCTRNKTRLLIGAGFFRRISSIRPNTWRKHAQPCSDCSIVYPTHDRSSQAHSRFSSEASPQLEGLTRSSSTAAMTLLASNSLRYRCPINFMLASTCCRSADLDVLARSYSACTACSNARCNVKVLSSPQGNSLQRFRKPNSMSA
mmetsp:Transcript_38088/g.91433  ORF Transcript_38088/g.91433 Transcript_38088/m.91433 type:complete len:207 (-) Transcript_38088:1782-2402(-)